MPTDLPSPTPIGEREREKEDRDNSPKTQTKVRRYSVRFEAQGVFVVAVLLWLVFKRLCHLRRCVFSNCKVHFERTPT